MAVVGHLLVRLKVLPHGRGLPLPAPATAGSAGYDLRAAIAEPLALDPGDRVVVPTGIALAIPDGYEGQVRPRSGLAVKHGVTVLNAPGTLDSDYRGEVRVPLINHGRERFVIQRGDRIAQLVVAAVERVRWLEQDDLDGTVRGSGGFGSTG
jgi:dUTP pyrophosphatase